MKPYRVGILGATGIVGQRIVERLAGHPWFRIAAVAASDRSVGRGYAEAAEWVLPHDPPPEVAALPVLACAPDAVGECDFVFSALDSDVAREVEPSFAEAGFAVISNSSAFRQRPDVPLLIPEVNPSHVELIDAARKTGGGYIVTNPNCSVAGLVLALAPLHREYGVRRVVVATLQAISGAGASGPRALALVDNVLPFIAGEEEKLEQELRKILGTLRGGAVEEADVVVSAHCHRVPTIDGHLEAVSVELARPLPASRVAALLESWRGEISGLGLPSAPERPIVVRHERDRPQPRLDRDRENGMSVVVGRIRECPVLGLKLELLSHNAVRGAAGTTVLNAELLAAKGLLTRREGR